MTNILVKPADWARMLADVIPVAKKAYRDGMFPAHGCVRFTFEPDRVIAACTDRYVALTSTVLYEGKVNLPKPVVINVDLGSLQALKSSKSNQITLNEDGFTVSTRDGKGARASIVSANVEYPRIDILIDEAFSDDAFDNECDPVTNGVGFDPSLVKHIKDAQIVPTGLTPGARGQIRTSDGRVRGVIMSMVIVEEYNVL